MHEVGAGAVEDDEIHDAPARLGKVSGQVEATPLEARCGRLGEQDRHVDVARRARAPARLTAVQPGGQDVRAPYQRLGQDLCEGHAGIVARGRLGRPAPGG